MAPGILRAPSLPFELTDGHADSGTHRAKLEHYDAEPIAIIGMGCRLPGGIDSPSKLWNLLVEGKSTQSNFPPSRLNIDAFYDSKIDRPGSITTAGGYFLDEDVREFDNEFFGINNLEATYMDPEQRKLLEVVFECFESAGTTLEAASGANIGCYVGKFTYDFQTMQSKDPEYLHRYSATGMSTTILANRVSHVFNLQGPSDYLSLVIDTACSSSLYCLHMACNALASGECDSAIVAGANLIQSPEQHIATMKAGVLSPTSTCHTFDMAADGYGRGESVAALYVKRLGHAIRDGDPIRSVIRGTAVNSNERTPGITLPSVLGQERVIRKAYAAAHMSPDKTDYVECHGTGTPVGDPIELEAISRVFQRPFDHALLVGSVKPSVGHSEAASALASIIKVTLALENGEIPATFGVSKVNQRIRLNEWGIKIVTKNTPWPTGKQNSPRTASINSFGFGGANAHAILEDAMSHVPDGYTTHNQPPSLARSKFLLPFSANDINALESRVLDLKPLCQRHLSIADLASSLGARRSRLRARGFILAGPQSLSADLQLQNLYTNKGYEGVPPQSLAFVYTGQGAQWAQMGLDLMQEFPDFQTTIRRLDRVLHNSAKQPQWTLEEIISEPRETSLINCAAYAQPVCTAIQIALTKLLGDWGIHPDYVVGHSSGEICAAYAAGVISEEEAILVAYHRGYVCSKVEKKGAMLATGCSHLEALNAIEVLGLQASVQVACLNSPENVTISGDHAGIVQLHAHFQARSVFARELKTDGKAYHSKHMATVGSEYEELLTAAITSCPLPKGRPTMPQWISTVTGEFLDLRVGPEYWRRNLESPVRFADAIQRLIRTTGVHFIEIGPHSVLELPIKQVVFASQPDQSNVRYGSALLRGRPGIESLLMLMGNLYLFDHRVSFSSINRTESPTLELSNLQKQGSFVPDLPNYKWNHDSYFWNESRFSTDFRIRQYPRHDILGSRLPGTNGAASIWRNILRVKDVPWLNDHRVDKQIVFPAAGYIAMAIEAACQLQGKHAINLPPCCLRNLTFSKALVLSEDDNEGVELHTNLHLSTSSLNAGSHEEWQFSVVSCLGNDTVTHASGNITFEVDPPSLRKELSIQEVELEPQPIRAWYDRLAQVGLNFSGHFRSLIDIRNSRGRISGQTIAAISLKHDQEGSSYALHPSVLDGILHTGLIATAGGVLKSFQLRLPVSINSIQIHIPSHFDPEERVQIHATASPIETDSMEASSEAFGQDGKPFMQVKGCRLIVPFREQQIATSERHPMLSMVWKPDITRFKDSSSFLKYIQSWQPSNVVASDNAETSEFYAALDLLTHKFPDLRIGALQHDGADESQNMLKFLEYDTTFKRCRSFVRITRSDEGGTCTERTEPKSVAEPLFADDQAAQPASCDLLLQPQSRDSSYNLNQIRHLLSPNGMFLGRLTDLQMILWKTAGFSFTLVKNSVPSDLVLARRIDENEVGEQRIGMGLNESDNREFVLIERNANHELNNLLEATLVEKLGHSIKRLPFASLASQSLKPECIVIATVELEDSLFAPVTTEDMSLVKSMTDTASCLLWLTGGSLLSGSRPNFAIASGLSRAVMLEQPALTFLVMDIDHLSFKPTETVDDILYVLAQGLKENRPDFEFIEHQGTLHVSRFVPESKLNQRFRRKQELQIDRTSIEEVKPYHVTVEKPGHADPFVYRKIEDLDDDLRSDHIEIDVKLLDLDSHSAKILRGHSQKDRGNALLQYTGVIVRVGRSVQDLCSGDRVIAVCPGSIKSRAKIPAWACIKRPDDQNELSTPFLSACSAALFALRHSSVYLRAQSVLVTPGASNIGVHAIQAAQSTGARVFATIRNVDEENYLMNELGMAKGNIIHLDDISLLERLLAASESQGFDFILSATEENLLPVVYESCADFGHIVEMTPRSSHDDSSWFDKLSSRGRSYMTFNLLDLFSLSNQRHQHTWNDLLKRSMECSKTSKHSCLPSKSFDAGNVAEAFRYLDSQNQIGKATISFQDSTSLVRAVPLKYDSLFYPNKTYFLVGCLGGLGRSISRWMLSRGARSFLFLNRSGLEQRVASDFVSELQRGGAHVTVVKGDAANFLDVENALMTLQKPLGGVIQAAMGLNESLFTTMTAEQWNSSMLPKVLGTWNIHNAILGDISHALDFFLMTSSVSGSIGVATEANYCAANYFLDVFARYRLNLGLPATSLGLGMISQVGYLHEHPDIQDMLTTKGVSALDEDDFLQIVDTALARATASSTANRRAKQESRKISCQNKHWAGHGDEDRYDALSAGHILTGLEPLGLNALLEQGFELSNATFDDPRAARLSSFSSSGSPLASTFLQSTITTSNLPAPLLSVSPSKHALADAALPIVVKQFSNFLLTPVEKVDTRKPLAAFGIDSMLAAAVKRWFYKTFAGVDVSFFMLISSEMTIETLAAVVGEWAEKVLGKI